jgi:hypothetical protein
MNYENEKTHLIYQTFLLIASVGCMAIGAIGLTLLALNPKWIHTILGLLSA